MSDIVLDQGPERKRYVRKMFNAIAHRYDFLNHFLSLGVDIWWRRQTVNLLQVDHDSTVLDLACGTGDLAIAAHSRKGCRVIGADLAGNMLRFGHAKLNRKGLDTMIDLVLADGEQLPFASDYFHAAMIAFGIRNMGDRLQALRELHRVLEPGGQLAVLEFSLPTVPLLRGPYLFYFNQILPRLGHRISHDEGAYQYLPASVEKFPAIEDFKAELVEAGFGDTRVKPMFGGIAVIYTAVK